MKIVSYIVESFLEYEDKISLVLFSYGCNMKCSYCYNYNFITDYKHIIKEPVETIIDNNITPLTDAIVFLGGEPTIYGDSLLQTAQYVKTKHNLATKLFTNGTNADVVIEGVRTNLFDLVSMDFKSYFPNDEITYGDSWSNYIISVEKILKMFHTYGITNRLEVRMTVVPALERELVIVKEICNNMRIKFIKQTDVKPSYDSLGVTNVK